LYSAFIIAFNPVIYATNAASHQDKPVEVVIKNIPESALSKASAEFISFIMGGIKSTWMRYFALREEEEKKSTGSARDKLVAFQLAAFRGILLATPAVMGVIALQGAKIGMKMLKHKLVLSKIAILNQKQKPYYGYMARIQRWWSKDSMQQMVINDEVIDRLKEIEKKTVLLHDLIKQGKNRHYANLLLSGESGTGKTLFAQQLAYRTNMDFLPVTAASLLQEGLAGLKHFDELIAIANNSSYGAIIFIDEADGLLTNRTIIDPNSDHYKILEHILSVIDGRSNKFMIIAATNHEDLLDVAMNRRFQDHVVMPLPDAKTREKLFHLYAKNVLFDEKETNKEFVDAAKNVFTDEQILSFVEKTESLSHAEIADIIEAIRSKAELNKRGVIIADIESAIAQAVIKHQKGEKHTQRTSSLQSNIQFS
jgi:AAA+ superfamily predicted ATPase